MKAQKNRKKVLVGMSGGVDSSLAAALLVEDGFEVTGIYLKAWSPMLNVGLDACPWQDDIADARQVAAFLGIPFTVIDVAQAYQQRVINVLKKEYAAGRTPNPDIWCNREMKFGIMLDLAKKMGFGAAATGHYARIRIKHQASSIKHQLLRGVDEKKDQTYFLWQLTQKDLPNLLFPIGHLTKNQVRQEAQKRNLLVAYKKDSQGICFLGPISLRDFLRRELKSQPGKVIDVKGNTIGSHQGAQLYTIGQRHGFSHSGAGKTYYVVRKDVKKNVIVVATQPPKTRILAAKNLNWLAETPRVGQKVAVRIRHGQKLEPARVSLIKNDMIKLKFENKQNSIAAGQSMVLYDKNLVLGGGIII